MPKFRVSISEKVLEAYTVVIEAPDSGKACEAMWDFVIRYGPEDHWRRTLCENNWHAVDAQQVWDEAKVDADTQEVVNEWLKEKANA